MMTSEDCVKKLDWQSAIVAATLELEFSKTLVNNNQPPQINQAESYLYRGIARCFIADKEGKHKEAIEDLSNAIGFGDIDPDDDADFNDDVNNGIDDDDGSDDDKTNSYYYRAYAFYLDGDYEKAIADCRHIKKKPRRNELLGKIYFAMSKYVEAVKYFRRLIYWYNNNSKLPPPGLLDSYREACKRMNSV